MKIYFEGFQFFEQNSVGIAGPLRRGEITRKLTYFLHGRPGLSMFYLKFQYHRLQVCCMHCFAGHEFLDGRKYSGFFIIGVVCKFLRQVLKGLQYISKFRLGLPVPGCHFDCIGMNSGNGLMDRAEKAVLPHRRLSSRWSGHLTEHITIVLPHNPDGNFLDISQQSGRRYLSTCPLPLHGER